MYSNFSLNLLKLDGQWYVTSLTVVLNCQKKREDAAQLLSSVTPATKNKH